MTTAGGEKNELSAFRGNTPRDGLAGSGEPSCLLPPGGGVEEAEFSGAGVLSALPPRPTGTGIPLPVSTCFRQIAWGRFL